MIVGEDHLYFERIDMEPPDFSSICTRCGEHFRTEPRPGERIDDVLLRMRAEFEAHQCRA
jgi:hypothetical protein